MANNKTIDLGVITRVENLRSIWPDEARDFTPWLAKEENLKLLGDAVGLDLVLEEKESSVGAFSADIFVKEEGMDNRIAVIAMIVEDLDAADELNRILHEYGSYVIGRMGIPYRERSISLISVAVDAPNEVISAMTGKLGALNGGSVKTAYSKS